VKLPSAEAIEKLRVLVAGDVMLDRYWYGAVDRISPEAPVPVVRVQSAQERLGGAANVAHNTRALGAPTTLVGILGSDAEGDSVRRLLEAEGITNACVADAALRTVSKLRVIGRQQQLVRLDFEEQPAAAALQAFDAQALAALAQSDVLICSDYAKGSLGGVASLIAAARATGRPVFVDPKGRDWSRYAGADLVTPNAAELQAVVGDWADEEALYTKAQNLRTQLKWGALLLTRGAQGMSLFDASGARSVDAQAREVFDVTGAGDTVIAVLTVLVAAGMPLRDALVAANAAAGRVVARLGTAALTWAELQQAWAEHPVLRA
jgi:D-glycero-beta-D-manno-heptose-7-phosphate kinase